MLRQKKAKAEVFQWTEPKSDPWERLRLAAASKLCVWHEHLAGGGSHYITIGELGAYDKGFLKLRFADHANTSWQHGPPDFNFVNRHPTDQEVIKIGDQIQYPRLCKKTAFAMHVGLTVPKLKKLLTPDCYDDLCENEAYPNTYTQYVVIATALNAVEAAGVTERIPIRQELYSMEDYNGPLACY